jgi:hypothetical protein
MPAGCIWSRNTANDQNTVALYVQLADCQYAGSCQEIGTHNRQ